MGCPVDHADLVGYTALFHSVMNIPVLDLSRILIAAGANVNHRNKFGSVMLHESLMGNHWESIDLLLEHGADMDIPRGDGLTPRYMYVSLGPQVTAVFQKWIRKRAGEEEGPLESKQCKACGSKGPKLSLCSRCRLVKYCSRECQSTQLPHRYLQGSIH